MLADVLGRATGEFMVGGSRPGHVEHVPYTGATEDVDLGSNDLYGANVNRDEGLMSDPVITQGAGCTVNVTSVNVCIRDDATFGDDDKLLHLTVPAVTNLPLTDDTVNHLYVDYNAGNPIYAASTDRTVLNMSNRLPAGRIAMRGGVIYRSTTFAYLGRSPGPRMLQRTVRLEPTVGAARESGLLITEIATRKIRISSGNAWLLLNQLSLPQITQGDGGVTTRHWYHATGTWTYADVAQYPTTHYDNGTDLVELSANRYAVLWVYRCATASEISTVYGTGDYKLTDAQESVEPARPSCVSEFGVLVGRIIVKKGDSAATAIDSAFTTSFSGIAVEHNDLLAKQGGTDVPSEQYYHLTSDEYTGLSNNVPYTGATSDVDLGANSIYADNAALSEGMFTEPAITDATGVNIAVTSADVLIRSDTTWGNDGKLYRATVPANTSLAVTDNVVNYLHVTYNSGSPIYAVTTDRNAMNHSDKIPVARLAIRSGNIEYKLMYGTLAKAAAARNIDRVNHIRGSYGIERESGLTITETATRVVNISAGYAWFGLNRITLPLVYQGGTDMFSDLHYHSGGTWTETTATQYNNLNYDNGTNLVELTAGRYAVNWIFRNLTKLDIDIVLGRGDYTLAQATASTIPPLQDETDNFYVLCGRIIVKKGDSTATSIETVSSTAFSRASVSIHNDLGGIQGGTAGEYYHLTAAQLSWIETQMGA